MDPVNSGDLQRLREAIRHSQKELEPFQHFICGHGWHPRGWLLQGCYSYLRNDYLAHGPRSGPRRTGLESDIACQGLSK